jgi:hypothetical protein
VTNKITSILIVSILILGFNGNVGILEKSSKYISSDSNILSTLSFPLAFAESDKSKDTGSGDKSSQKDKSGNNGETGSQSKSEGKSENSTLIFKESNGTQVENKKESKETKNENKQDNKTQTQNEQKSKSEIENENNNINATHKMTDRDSSDIEGAKTNQTIAAEIDVGIGHVEHKSIDNSVIVKTENATGDSVVITVNASSGTGPKVILINLNSTTINVANMKLMHVLYDGHPITPAANVNQILHTTSSDPPRYAILITQSGAQILVSIPHFSTHTITLDSISKVISTIPEFPISMLVMLIAIALTVVFYRIKSFKI